MHRRTRVRLGDDEPVLGARQLAHFLAEFNRSATSLVLRQYTKAGAFDRAQELLLSAFEEPVFAVAQEGEVIVGHPAQQRLAFLQQLGVRSMRSLAQRHAGCEHLAAHFRPVTNSRSHIRQDLENFLFQHLEMMQVGFAVDRKSDVGFDEPATGIALEDFEQLATRITPHPKYRVNGHVYGKILVCDGRGHRVH